jgi:CBS domain-containing protein
MGEIVQLLRKRSVVIVVDPPDGQPEKVSSGAAPGDGTPRDGAPRYEADAVGSRPRPVGIFTERDYLDKLVTLEANDWLNVKYNPVERHMTQRLQSLSTDDSLERAIQLMTKRGYRHLPIVDEVGGLYGVISAGDIIAYLAEYFPMEIYNLPPSLDQDRVFNTREGG